MDETRQMLVAELRRQVEGDETSASVAEGRGDITNIKQEITIINLNKNYKIRQRLCLEGVFQQVEIWTCFLWLKHNH